MGDDTQPRIRERIRNSKNIVLFLSSFTVSSKALREEIEYGITDQGLPVIAVYPDFLEKSDIILCESKTIRQQVKDLWGKLPMFRDSMHMVPTLHIPKKKELIRKALQDPDFESGTKAKVDKYFYPC